MVSVITGVLLIVIAYLAVKQKSWGLLLVLIGGSLNWWERVTNGYVADYWRIWGTNIYNNINDWLIFVGVVWFLWKNRK